MAKRPSKRPASGDSDKNEIPPPPDTQPEGRGVVLSPPDETDGAEDYYKRIHAHRTLLALKAVRPGAPPAGMAVLVDDDGKEEGAPSFGAQALLQRVFAAEKEAANLRERLAEAIHERDAARGEALKLRTALDSVEAAVTRARS